MKKAISKTIASNEEVIQKEPTQLDKAILYLKENPDKEFRPLGILHNISVPISAGNIKLLRDELLNLYLFKKNSPIHYNEKSDSFRYEATHCGCGIRFGHNAICRDCDLC